MVIGLERVQLFVLCTVEAPRDQAAIGNGDTTLGGIESPESTRGPDKVIGVPIFPTQPGCASAGPPAPSRYEPVPPE